MTTAAGQYGPQTTQVEALIARAATLTAGEIAWLAAGGDAAWDAAWVAAEDAAGAADRSAVEAAIDAAVEATVEAGARGAVTATARAVAMRDLIGVAGWTQDCYDVLTWPWWYVIGPVHPDDARR